MSLLIIDVVLSSVKTTACPRFTSALETRIIDENNNFSIEEELERVCLESPVSDLQSCFKKNNDTSVFFNKGTTNTRR